MALARPGDPKYDAQKRAGLITGKAEAKAPEKPSGDKPAEKPSA